MAVSPRCRDGGLWGADEALPQCVHDQLEAAVQLEFLEDRREVIAHRRFADVEVLGNLAVGKALPENGDELPLPKRQSTGACSVGRGLVRALTS